MTLKALARFLPIIVASLMIVGAAAAEELTTFKLCKLIPTEWADGDSFLIQTAGGTSHTIRLYGADCIEWHVSDETDARRLRAQRRYFGISDLGGSPQGSIDAAKELGQGRSGGRERGARQNIYGAYRICRCQRRRKTQTDLRVCDHCRWRGSLRTTDSVRPGAYVRGLSRDAKQNGGRRLSRVSPRRRTSSGKTRCWGMGKNQLGSASRRAASGTPGKRRVESGNRILTASARNQDQSKHGPS